MVRGDLILEFNGQPVDNLEVLPHWQQRLPKVRWFALLLRRPDGSFGYVAVTAE
jgi:serine protease Do